MCPKRVNICVGSEAANIWKSVVSEMQQLQEKNCEDYRQELFALQKQIHYLQRVNSSLQTGLQERSLGRKYAPYLFLFGWFLVLEFIKNWMGNDYFISLSSFMPILILLVVFVVLDVRREKKRQSLREQIRVNKQRCDQLQREIEGLKRKHYK